MATGDPSDMLARLEATLPAGWFASASPVLDATLAGFAAGWALLYGQQQYVQSQTRIATATDVNLDMVAADFFGAWPYRQPEESDASFRTRVKAELLAPRGTRTALIANLVALTGQTPIVFEPANANDTGAYGGRMDRRWQGLAYGQAGGWGSLALPFQSFVTAFRASAGGIATVGGYRTGAGGYGVGALQYITLGMVQSAVTDADIIAEIAATVPAGSIAWANIGGPALGGVAPLGSFILGINILGAAA